VKVEAKSLSWGYYGKIIDGCLPHEGFIKKEFENGEKVPKKEKV